MDDHPIGRFVLGIVILPGEQDRDPQSGISLVGAALGPPSEIPGSSRAKCLEARGRVRDDHLGTIDRGGSVSRPCWIWDYSCGRWHDGDGRRARVVREEKLLVHRWFAPTEML